MANYKSLQVADAVERISQSLAPKVSYTPLANTNYGQSTLGPDATAPVYQGIQQANQYYNNIADTNTGTDYLSNSAVALGKGIVSVPQAAAGLVDLADAGLQAVSGAEVQGGRFTKALEELGVGFKETQDALGGLYSEGTQKQLQGLAALPGMSTEKSLGDNLSSLGQTAGYVLDNPSLAFNTIVESLPAIAAGGVVGRGAAALGARGAEGAIGEGTVMAGQAQANMDRNAEGYTTGSQALGALGIGVLGGAVGQLGSKFAASHGAHDIDQLATGVPNQVANKGLTSLAVGTATEAAEEAAQSSLENVIANITSGKDAIQGLNQDLVLGTLAGAGMGAASNAKSSLSSAALEAVTKAAIKQSERIKERIAKSAPERSDIDTADLSNPSSPNYNPTAAIVREAGKLTGDSTPEEISAIKENVDGVMESAESKLAELTEMKSVIDSEATWKANLAKAQTAIQNLGDTDPVKSEKFQAAIDQVILPKLEQIEQVKAAATNEQLDGAISQAGELVKNARVMHDKYSTALGQAATTLNGAVDKQIFGAPTSFSLDQIQSAINDASISDVSKVALRALSDAVVAQNAVKDLDAVNQQVTGASLDPKYMSTPQYLEQFGAAIQRGSTKAQANLLGQINAFETSHVAKAKLADTAFQFANQLGRSVQIIKADGEWKVNAGKPLKGDEAEQNGALTIHPAKNGKKGSEGVVNYMNTEASAITATRAAMEAMINVNTNTPKASVSQPSSEAVQEVPTQQDVGTPDPMQDALDSYNQEARDNYDFQPDRRSVDPRDNETRPSTAGVKPTETATRTEVQPNSGSTPASSQTSGTAKADEGVASTQAQSKRKEDKTESTTSTVDTPKSVRGVNDKGDIQFTGLTSTHDRELKPLSIVFRKQDDGSYVSSSKAIDFHGVTTHDPDAKIEDWLNKGELLEIDPNNPQTYNKYFVRDPETSVLTPNEDSVIDSHKVGDSVVYLMDDGHVLKQTGSTTVNIMLDQVLIGIPFDVEVSAKFTTKGVANKAESHAPFLRMTASQFKQWKQLEQLTLENQAKILHPEKPFLDLVIERSKAAIKDRNITILTDKPNESKTLVIDSGEHTWKKIGENIHSNPILPREIKKIDNPISEVQNVILSDVQGHPHINAVYVPPFVEGASPDILKYLAAIRGDRKPSTQETTKPSVTKEMAEDILEGKYSSTTHTTYQKEDGNWDVRKKTFDEQVDEVADDNGVQAFDDYEPQVDGDGEKPVKNPERDAERAKPINKRNLIVDGFNQRDTVLNRNEDFATKFLGRDNLIPAVEKITGNVPNEKQHQALKDFAKFNKFFSTKLDGLIFERKGKTAKGNDYADFRYQDFNQFLLEDGSLPENVKTAVAAAMYTWVAENGSKTLNTEKDVAGLLLVSDVDNLPSSVFSALTAVGDHQSVVTGSLGQKALEALGLKVVSDVDSARKQKLEQALGTLAAVALTQNGYLEHSTMPMAQFEQLQQLAQDANDRSYLGNQTLKNDKVINFLVPKSNAKVDQVIKSAAETSGIVPNLFGVQRDMKLPSLEPITSTPNSYNRTGSQLPTYTKEMLELAQKNGYKMSSPAMSFMDNVSPEDLRELFGYVQPNVDGVSFDGVHKKFWESQLASNQAVERAISIIKEQRANLGDDSKEFFFEHTSWTNTRSGYDSAFNLQSTKIHRAVAGMSAHVVEVGIEAPMRKGETTKFGEFLQAVAMGAEGISKVMGIQTVDKMSAESFLPKMQEYLAQDYVQDGIESMAAAIEGKPSKQDMDNIKALVTEFDMGPMSVRALQALAQMYIAERDGARTFNSDIGFESDGVTNGPVITNVALHTADADMLEAGGIFTDKNKTNVPTNKELGKEDIYEQLGAVMKAMWADYKKAIKGDELASALGLDAIYKAFGERSGAKPIVTTSNYGAGIGSIKRANAREVLNAFYKGLEKSANDSTKAGDLIRAVNETIKYSNRRQKLNVPLAIAQGNPLEFLLTPDQESALFYAANEQHGKAVKDTLDSAMSNFNVVRDINTEHAVAGFAAYEIIRNAAIEEALKDTTDVLVDGTGNRQEGLTSEQMKKVLKAIERYTPSVVSGMGNMSSNKKKSSIPLMKQDAVWDASKMSEQQFNFVGSWQAKGTGKFSVRSAIKRDGVQDPGVSGLALIIQSIDAMIAHTTIGKMITQNYHDANASAVGQGKAMARIQNEAFVDGLLNTHVNREFTRAAAQAFQAFIDMPELLNSNTEQAKAAYEMLSQPLNERVAFAYQQDIAKLRNMLTWVNINQYGTQGGHYVMTDAKRVEILKQIKQLKKDLKKDLAQAKAIESLFNPTAATPKTIEDILRTDGTMKGEDLVPKLQAELKQFQSKEGTVGKFSQFYDSMLDLITDRMPAGLEINYFSEADAPSNVVGLDEAIDNNNPAWFTTGKDGNPQINILKSNDPIETLVHVHELVHAITVDSIAQVRNDPTAHAKAKESLDKIDALYEDIKAKVNADPKASKLMKYAVQNVEEFIATGFSYPEFVNYLDSQIAPKAARGKSRIVTALHSFVENILGVLESFTGRKYSAKDATALEALILDTTEFLGRIKPSTVGSQTTIYGAPQQARDNVAGYTSKQVFDALDSNLDPAFKAHLSSLMTQVSDTIYAGLDQALINNPDGTWSVEKAWEEYIKAGKVNTTETATTAGFRMTEQESFAVESLYAALVHGLKDKAMSQVYAEMDKAFKVSKAKLKPQDFYEGDWATADKDDKRDAQDMHDFVFKYSSGNPEPLARFTAMALGSQQFNNLLGFAAKEVTQEPVGLFEKIVNGANDLVDYVGGLLTNSNSSQLVNNKLGLLSKELARIDAKNRDFAVGKVEAQLEKIADFTDGMSQKLRDQVVELVEHDAIANSRFTSVRFASNVTRLSAKGDLWTTLDVIKDGITQYNPNERLGIVGEIINEAANNDATKDGVEKVMRLTKLNNQMKENIRDATTKNVMSTFEENGAYLTEEDKSSLATMLRSDIQHLTSTYSTAEIAKLYSDTNFRNTEIKALEAQLKDQVLANRAKQLAKYMVTGKSSNGLVKNTQLIVSGFNTGEVVDSSDVRVSLVDTLASLYAVSYTSNKDKARLNVIMKRELKNKTNGIDTAIKFHKELAKTAKETLFIDNPTSAIKGFIPEITNPNREIRIANTDAEAKLLKEQFYKEVKSLAKDAKDPSKVAPRLFLTEEANIQRLVSGAVEVVSTNRKGSPVLFTGKEFHTAVTAVKKSIPTAASYNPMLDQDVHMTPNYNTQNEVIGFSYEMSGNNRDVLLERNNDFSELLGAYAATNFNKVTVPEQNNRVVDAALEDYKANFASNPRAYVTVGPNSNDYGLREVWAMMPESTRKHIINTWGKDGMQVRNDVLLPMFGYRKYSLNQSFDKMDEAKNMFEKLYTGVMTGLFGSSAKICGVQAERAWQESVSLMKDIIVIRNVKTMIANIMTNSMLLMAHGVSPTDIVKDTLLSVRAGMQYRRDMANLLAAQQKQRAGVGDFNKLEQDILRLQDSLSRNPLSGFIEEGMMPTIVEDVDPDTNHYSYKSKLQKRIDAYTDLVPKSVKTAAKWAFVSPDTPLYKLLNNATQFSDFSSKYVMYKYYTQKAKEKLSHDAALQIASDNFVNYDVPTARGLQYLNDMGIVMFTKYNIRIQKALFQLLKKRPATAMAQALFINSFTNMEAGIDPLIWFNMGNPLRSGGLGLPSALDEPIPIKMLTSVF